MKSNLPALEKKLDLYLSELNHSTITTTFNRIYIQLLFLFKDKLSPTQVEVLDERQKQLNGEAYCAEKYSEQITLSRKMLEGGLNEGSDHTIEAVMQRLFFCAMLDGEEEDIYYHIEPIFLFVRTMDVPFDLIKGLLESEFKGFKY